MKDIDVILCQSGIFCVSEYVNHRFTFLVKEGGRGRFSINKRGMLGGKSLD